jgi:rhodanese-related sulfurtransferase
MTNPSKALSQANHLLKPHQLLRLQQTKSQVHGPLVIDIRGARAYGKAHIPGSHRIGVPSLLSGEALDSDLVLVGDRQEDTEAVAESLYDGGFQRLIQHLEGGFPHWQDQGFDVTSLRSRGHGPASLSHGWVPVLSVVPLLVGLQQLCLPLVAIGGLFAVAPSIFGFFTERAWQQTLRRSA